MVGRGERGERPGGATGEREGGPGGSPDDALAALQRAVGYVFREPALLERALTHASFRNEVPDVHDDNERLEFLGDAVLELAVSELLYRRYPDFPEGRLTRLRASLVNTRTLAEVSRELGLGRALRLGRGEEATGGRSRRSTLADVFEATLGAVYLDASGGAGDTPLPPGGLDGGLAAARGVVERTLAPRLEVLARGDGRDAKTRLQEWAQERHHGIPTYEIIGRRGPDHDVIFRARVTVGERGAAEGEGRSKREAHRVAAAALLAAVSEGSPAQPETAPERVSRAPKEGPRRQADDAGLDGPAPAA